jgi:hypothetical protein
VGARGADRLDCAPPTLATQRIAVGVHGADHSIGYQLRHTARASRYAAIGLVCPHWEVDLLLVGLGWLMLAIPWRLTEAVWLYSTVWMVRQGGVELAVYRLLDYRVECRSSGTERTGSALPSHDTA